jgi:hypothetical protein
VAQTDALTTEVTETTETEPAEPDEPTTEPAPPEPTTEDVDETEEAQPTEDAGVSVVLAGLPVGGFDEVSVQDPTLRCVHVNWSGPPELPPGLNLEVVRFDLAPEGVFDVVDGGCSGDLPSCFLGAGVLDESAQCDVAVRQVAPSPDGTGSLGLAEGRISCEAPDAWRCQEFEGALATTVGEPGRIEWFDALLPPPDVSDVTGATQDG